MCTYLISLTTVLFQRVEISYFYLLKAGKFLKMIVKVLVVLVRQCLGRAFTEHSPKLRDAPDFPNVM